MSIYDKASLVLIPSGTKTSKVYSQVPVSGDGDFTFSRSTAATRVNADGVIEKETQNLLTYSNGFNSWGQTGVSLTSGQSGYDGSSDAWLLTTSAVAGYINRAVVNSGVQTYSIYAKAGTETGLFIRLNGGSNPRCFFNLTDGLVGNDSGGVIKGFIEDVGGGWYRCSIACNDTSTDARVYVATSSGTFPSTGSIYIQDAQLEQGLVARDYIETTTTAVEGGITDNVPRLDYTDSSCPSLLLEPQRTNLYTYSEYGGIWNTTLATITDNYAESPEGYNNAFRANFSNNSGLIYISGTGATGGDNTLSVWAKSNTGTDQVFRFFANGNTLKSDNFTATTEWQRFTFTHNCTNVTAGITGNSAGGLSDILFYGFQQEAGSYATSYIPTYGSAVTRNMPTLQNLSLGDYIGQTQGTIFVDVEYLDGTGDDVFRINNNVDGIGISKNQNSMVMRTYQSGVRTDTTGSTTADSIKVAYVYTSSGIKMFINGALNTSRDFSVSFGGTLDELILYGNAYYIGRSLKRLNQVLVFPTALTDQEAIDLTTL